MRRGNRHLVGVVLGGRSGGSRDAIMRNLLAENLEKAATTRTVAAITERNTADANTDVAESKPDRARPIACRPGAAVASAEPGAGPCAPRAPREDVADGSRRGGHAPAACQAASSSQARDQGRGQA